MGSSDANIELIGDFIRLSISLQYNNVCIRVGRDVEERLLL